MTHVRSLLNRYAMDLSCSVEYYVHGVLYIVMVQAGRIESILSLGPSTHLHTVVMKYLFSAHATSPEHEEQ